MKQGEGLTCPNLVEVLQATPPAEASNVQSAGSIMWRSRPPLSAEPRSLTFAVWFRREDLEKVFFAMSDPQFSKFDFWLHVPCLLSIAKGDEEGENKGEYGAWWGQET